jgi:hypothetical protein
MLCTMCEFYILNSIICYYMKILLFSLFLTPLPPHIFFKHWHIPWIKLCVQILKSAEPLLFFVNFLTFFMGECF